MATTLTIEDVTEVVVECENGGTTLALHIVTARTTVAITLWPKNRIMRDKFRDIERALREPLRDEGDTTKPARSGIVNDFGFQYARKEEGEK